MFKVVFATRHPVLNYLRLDSLHRCSQLSLEVETHCLHCGRLAVRSLPHLQLWNPGSIGKAKAKSTKKRFVYKEITVIGEFKVLVAFDLFPFFATLFVLNRSVIQFNLKLILPFLFTEILSLSIVNHLFFTSLCVIDNARNELHNEDKVRCDPSCLQSFPTTSTDYSHFLPVFRPSEWRRCARCLMCRLHIQNFMLTLRKLTVLRWMSIERIAARF